MQFGKLVTLRGALGAVAALPPAAERASREDVRRAARLAESQMFLESSEFPFSHGTTAQKPVSSAA